MTYLDLSITDPNRKRCTSHSHRRKSILHYPRRRKRFSPCPATMHPMRDCHNSASEKPLHFELPVFLTGFLYITAALNSPLYSIKVLLCFLIQTCPWFCHSLLVLYCNSLLVLNKPILADKITDSFIFFNYITSNFLKRFYIFIYGGGVEGAGERESPANSLLREEPNMGLDLITLRS